MIRTLDPDDLDLVRDLREALHDHHAALPAMPGYRVREFGVAWEQWRAAATTTLADGRGVLFVHQPEGAEAPDGMAYLYDLDPQSLVRPIVEPTGLHVELSTLVVSESARGTGVGSALIEVGDRWARDRGAVAIHIRVRASNVDARRLYERRGAQPGFEEFVQAL